MIRDKRQWQWPKWLLMTWLRWLFNLDPRLFSNLAFFWLVEWRVYHHQTATNLNQTDSDHVNLICSNDIIMNTRSNFGIQVIDINAGRWQTAGCWSSKINLYILIFLNFLWSWYLPKVFSWWWRSHPPSIRIVRLKLTLRPNWNHQNRFSSSSCQLFASDL